MADGTLPSPHALSRHLGNSMHDIPSSADFDYDRHVVYFSSCLGGLPEGYSKLDTSRLTLVHFAVHALDLLGVWDDEEAQARLNLDKQFIIDWIYRLQVKVRDGYENHAGFRGGTYLGNSDEVHDVDSSSSSWKYDHGHIAMTYTALATLRTLEDSDDAFSRINKRHEIVQALRSLQLNDGSFRAIADESEHDMRFLYCACSISHMLDDWSGVDRDRAVNYIKSCRAYDGGIALLPGQEGHGGSTFCAVASLVLMQRLDDVLDDDWRQELVHWCVRRQVRGLQGRPNKDEDSCYSYWIGGTLRLLGQDELLNHQQLRQFVMQCQTQMGGFSKVIGTYPDLLHSYYSLAYLSMSNYHLSGESIGLKKMNCTLGICDERAVLFHPLFP
jgi:geranylgeranyl transferase type-1 subunit beta